MAGRAPMRLRVLPHGAGSVEWRVEPARSISLQTGRSLLLGLLAVALPAAWWGASWRAALLLGAGVAAAAAVAAWLLSVQHESLTYVRLLGVRLETRRRCGALGTSLFLPLRQLGSGIIIHEDVSATRADFYLALPLQPCGGPERSSGADSSPNGSSTPSGGAARQRHTAALKAGRGGSKRLTAEGGCEVAVVFPRLRPRLSLLRQVYQQLSPLLAADLESLRHGAVGGPSDEDGEEPPLPQPPLREEEIEESELR